MMGIHLGGGGFPPQSFQKAMVFIDGTNLFHRLKAAGLRVPSLKNLLLSKLGGRQVARIYLYTVEQQLQSATEVHGDQFLDGIRIILGEGIKKSDGNVKEKGVDAMLVADMVYHAASKNCEYALVVTLDTDFVHVVRRVEDFGCRSAVLSVCAQAPERLRAACDDYYEMDSEFLLQQGFAERIPETKK